MKGGVVLNSDSYSSQLIRTFSDLYKNNLLTDVTIVCDDRFRIEAHRMVLCASSPLLRDFITINAQSRPLIYLKGVKGPTLSVIMQFLYTGEVSIHQEELPSVLEAARELDIVELQELKDTQSPKPNNVFKEEETCLTPYVNTPSFSEMRIAEPKKSQKIIDSSYKCGDCEFRGKSQKQLLEHVEMLHTVDDYIAKDAFDIVDVLDTTNQEPMNGLQQLDREENGLKTKSIKIYESEVHKEYLQTLIKNVGNDKITKLKSKWRSECIHCGRVYSDNQASHLKDHLRKKHPEVFAAVQAADDQKKKLKMEELEKEDDIKNELALVQRQIQRAKTQSAGNTNMTELFYREAELKSRMLM